MDESKLEIRICGIKDITRLAQALSETAVTMSNEDWQGARNGIRMFPVSMAIGQMEPNCLVHLIGEHKDVSSVDLINEIHQAIEDKNSQKGIKAIASLTLALLENCGCRQ